MDTQPRCSECHRPLSDPESIRRGVGPVCWAKLTNVGERNVPKGTIRIPSKQRNRNPKVTENLDGVHQRLDIFINVKTSEEREINAILAKDREKELPLKKGNFSGV